MKDNNDVPISGAIVYNATLGTRTTDSNGAYYFENVPYGRYVIEARKSGYWTEKANVTITYPQIAVRQDYQLPDDIVTEWQPIVAIYSTVDTNKADVTLHFDITSGIQATVYDYAAGSGHDYTVSITERHYGHEYDKPSLVYSKQTRITGWFWATQSGQCMNCYCVDQYDEYLQFNTATDELNPGSVTKTPVTLTPGSSHGIAVTQTGSATFQTGICMSVSVGILGVTFGTILQSGVSVTSTTSLTVEISFTNTDTRSRTFYYYREGNVILHLWDEDNI